MYRKVLNFGALPNGSSASTQNKTMDIGVSNVDKMVHYWGVSYGLGYTMMLPYPHSASSDVINMFYEDSSHQIGVSTHKDRTGYTTTYIIVEYTKTTD